MVFYPSHPLSAAESTKRIQFNQLAPQEAKPGEMIDLIGEWGATQGNRRPCINRKTSYTLEVIEWSPKVIRVRLPKYLRPGMYKVGVYFPAPNKPGSQYSSGWKKFSVLPSDQPLPADPHMTCENNSFNAFSSEILIFLFLMILISAGKTAWHKTQQAKNNPETFPFQTGSMLPFVGYISSANTLRVQKTLEGITLKTKLGARLLILSLFFLFGPGILFAAYCQPDDIDRMPYFLRLLFEFIAAFCCFQFLKRLIYRPRIEVNLSKGEMQFFTHPLSSVKYCLPSEAVTSFEIRSGSFQGGTGNLNRSRTHHYGYLIALTHRREEIVMCTSTDPALLKEITKILQNAFC